jgi:hypothetical protein
VPKVIANATRLVFGQALQFIQADAALPNQVTQHQEEHGVFVLVLRVNRLPAQGQMAFKFP